jgi:hypothetical protein
VKATQVFKVEYPTISSHVQTSPPDPSRNPEPRNLL